MYSPVFVGTCWPWSATGIIASAIATAIMPRTRAGIMCAENTGASTKRPAQPGEHEQ